MTEAEVAKALKTSQRELERTQTALKKTTDLRIPKGAKQAWRKARQKLRDVRERLQERIPKLRERLNRKRRSGPQKAVSWGKSQSGVTEKPANSNWGHPVEDWIKYTGYVSPVPWCGCFVCWAVVKVGGANIPTRVRLGYAGYIASDAASGSNGLRAVPKDQAQAGDIFTIGSSHIGLVTGPASGGYIPTVEGNTSPSDSGSQYNGGAVAIKSRPLSMLTTVARPSY